MKNRNEVIRLLAGANRPSNSEVAGVVLQSLSNTDEADRDNTEAREVADMLLYDTDNAVDAAKITLALLIALPKGWGFVFSQVEWVMNGNHTKGRGDKKNISIFMEDRAFKAGFPIGLMEAGVWLVEHGQCDPDMRAAFAVTLGKHLFELLTQHHAVTLGNELSGRLANISGKFVQQFNYNLVLQQIPEKSEQASEKLRLSAADDDAGVKIVSEICFRAMRSLSADEQVRLLLNRKALKKRNWRKMKEK